MRKNRRLSGKVAKSYVESELRKRGYNIDLPTRNVARTDLSVKSPSGEVFWVKVTSLSYRNFWLIKDSPKDENRYFILVFMPEDKPPEFSIFNADEMQREKQNHLSSRTKPISEYKNPELEKLGLSFDQRENYKEKWSSLPK